MTSEEAIREVKRRHAPQLLSQPGVCGVGVEKDEKGEYVLTIHVDTDDPDIRSQLPGQLDGYPVRVVQSGPFRKFAP
jgi:hypothetical protein